MTSVSRDSALAHKPFLLALLVVVFFGAACSEADQSSVSAETMDALPVEDVISVEAGEDAFLVFGVHEGMLRAMIIDAPSATNIGYIDLQSDSESVPQAVQLPDSSWVILTHGCRSVERAGCNHWRLQQLVSSSISVGDAPTLREYPAESVRILMATADGNVVVEQNDGGDIELELVRVSDGRSQELPWAPPSYDETSIRDEASEAMSAGMPAGRYDVPRTLYCPSPSRDKLWAVTTPALMGELADLGQLRIVVLDLGAQSIELDASLQRSDEDRAIELRKYETARCSDEDLAVVGLIDRTAATVDLVQNGSVAVAPAEPAAIPFSPQQRTDISASLNGFLVLVADAELEPYGETMGNELPPLPQTDLHYVSTVSGETSVVMEGLPATAKFSATTDDRFVLAAFKDGWRLTEV